MFEKIFGNVKGIFNTITIIDLIASVIFILLGLVFFTNPAMSNIFVSIVTGLFLIANGATSLLAYFKRGGIVLFDNNLIYGILLIIVGILALFLGNVLSIILGIYLLAMGAQKVNYGIFLKRFNESSWLITIVVGVLFLVMAVITFFTSGDAAIKVTGIILFGLGLINFINTLLLRRRSKYFIA
ncbi:MAG: hypothetical protein E7161_01765 [Firmicutes bacterium]|nr:hypothetical protein [Bacillota bacterium]